MDSLNHVVENLNYKDSYILVLDTGAVIDSQAEAMLQALHSRSTGGIKHHLEILKKKGAKNFMKKFYVGYGHKSIGDCGSATVFVEGVSILAGKAVHDWRLYSGQVASTRYINFSEQAFLNPAKTEAGEEIQEAWRTFYLEALEPTQVFLKKKHPIQEGENPKVYEKAIAARSFDICRGFLPAGVSINVAIHMNLRQYADLMMVLRHHPLAEARDIAEKLEKALNKMYPESFGHQKYEKTEAYNQEVMENYYYENPNCQDFAMTFDGVNRDILKDYKNLLEHRPPKTEFPQFLSDCGTLNYEFLMDYGTFRDIHRHRALVQRMPLVTGDHGFEDWYIDSLPPELQVKARDLCKLQEERIAKLGVDKYEAQYYYAMGYRISCRISGDIKALTYMGELRATRFVHPTLVKRATQILDNLEEMFGEYGLVIHRDDEPNRFDVRRGEHDIVMKD